MIKRILLILICFVIFSFNTSNANQKKSKLENLKDYSKLETIDDETLNKCQTLISEILKDEDNNEREKITNYYGLICLKSSSDRGASAYIEYLIIQKDSTEEMLSFMFEPIFFKNPKIILQQISKFNPSNQKLLLDHIGWGFLNNNTSINRHNYKDKFFNKNPELKQLYGKYIKEIDRK